MEATANLKFLGNQLFLLASMLETAGSKLERSKPGKVLLSKCFAALQLHSNKPELSSRATLKAKVAISFSFPLPRILSFLVCSFAVVAELGTAETQGR